MNQVQGTLEATALATANKATWTGSLVTVVSGVTSSDIGMYAGIFIGVAGLAISWFFKHRADARYEQANRRYEEAHAAYMDRMANGGWVPQPPTPKEEESS